MRIPCAVKGKGVAMLTFDELCGSALGAADYTAISEAFHTVFVHGVPMMNLVHINQARCSRSTFLVCWCGLRLRHRKGGDALPVSC